MVDGINENNTIINREGWMNIHMPLYKNAMDKGVSTIMISYSSWNGVKMHANQDLVTGYLKNTLKFQIMVPNNYKQFISILTGIDDAVTGILHVKFAMGLFENPYTDPALAEQLGKQEHRDFGREAARKSRVLLKNGKIPSDMPLLPLPKKAPKILVAGSHADNLGYQCGRWTIEWHGDTSRTTMGTTLLDAVKAAVDPGTAAVFVENTDVEFVKNSGFLYANMAMGEHPYQGRQPERDHPKPDIVYLK